MDESFTVGLSHERTWTVTLEMSPPHLSGVLSTPRMVGLVEDTCLEALTPRLDEARTTVGTRIDMSHVGTARAGELVHVHVGLTKVTGNRLLSFQVEVTGVDGVIGTGSHQRLVIDKAQFADR